MLDLSFNQNVNSEHASDIVRTCDNLKYLNLSCTGVTALSSTVRNILFLYLLTKIQRAGDDVAVVCNVTFMPVTSCPMFAGGKTNLSTIR